ncbi:MAG: hypothetical protein R3345_04545 [Fulvivirga sp.]|nr:hypothetical protein [Fulvivirga sp.]
MIQKILLITAILLLTKCGQKQENERLAKSISNQVQTFGQAMDTIGIDSALFESYREVAKSGKGFEKILATQIIDNINTYANTTIDELILTIGKIDSNKALDTIYNHLWVSDDTVHLHSRWIKNDQVLWELELKDPYLYISGDNPLFEYEDSPVWTKLTIAKNYAIPELEPKVNYDHISMKWVVISGLGDLKEMGVPVDSTTYVGYVTNFKGELLKYGAPEQRRLVIWHAPSKRFVSYYSP